MSYGESTYVLTNIVFPFPGGPKRSSPLQGDRSPVNSWIKKESRSRHDSNNLHVHNPYQPLVLGLGG